MVSPPGLPAAKGFSHGIVAPAGARILFIAGQVGCDSRGVIVAGGFVEQFARAIDNVVAVLHEAGGEPEQLARMTIYVTDRDAYLGNLRELGAVWRERLGRHYPAIALVAVAGLVDATALVEIEATAALAPA